MFNYAKLLSVCLDVLKSYDSRGTGVDEHFEAFHDLNKDRKIDDEGERTFVHEVFTGCVRFSPLIKVVVDGFYAEHGRGFLRADSALFSVLSYLIMFRLEELGVAELKRFVLTQDIRKMHKFVCFFYATDNLQGWIQDEWCKLYEHKFVHINILSPMLRCESEMRALISTLTDMVDNIPTSKMATRPSPVPLKPFCLTAPRARRITVEMEEIPSLKPARPVPPSTYQRPNAEKRLSKECMQNRRKSELQAGRTQYLCATTEKSKKTMMIINKILSEREEREKISLVKATPAPSIMTESIPVKMTTAAILRGGARIQKEEEAIEKRFAMLESGRRDDGEFLKWQEEMKQRDMAEALTTLERKHLECQLSYEEAIIAKKRYVEDNRQLARKFRDESEQLMDGYLEQRKEGQVKMRRLVEDTNKGHKNTHLTREKLTSMKRKMVQQVAKEKQQLMEKLLEEELGRMCQRTNLIGKIRAMETVPIIRTNFVDLTATSDQGLLSEMSIAELRERLSLRTVAAEQKKKEKREAIRHAKQVKEECLSSTRDALSKHRDDQLIQSAKRRNDEEKAMEFQQNLKAQKLVYLQDKLESKRRERKELQRSSSSPVPMESNPPALQLHSKARVGRQPSGAAASSSHQTPGDAGLELLHSQNPMATLIKAANKA